MGYKSYENQAKTEEEKAAVQQLRQDNYTGYTKRVMPLVRPDGQRRVRADAQQAREAVVETLSFAKSFLNRTKEFFAKAEWVEYKEEQHMKKHPVKMSIEEIQDVEDDWEASSNH